MGLYHPPTNGFTFICLYPTARTTFHPVLQHHFSDSARSGRCLLPLFGGAFRRFCCPTGSLLLHQCRHILASANSGFTVRYGIYPGYANTILEVRISSLLYLSGHPPQYPTVDDIFIFFTISPSLNIRYSLYLSLDNSSPRSIKTKYYSSAIFWVFIFSGTVNNSKPRRAWRTMTLHPAKRTRS